MRFALRFAHAVALVVAIAGSIAYAAPTSAQGTPFATPVAGQSEVETGSLRITFRGCPDDADPTVDASGCTIPLDAPQAATLMWAASSLNIAGEVEREDDGTYVIPNLAANTLLTLTGFEPTDHNFLTFVGADATSPSDNDKWHPEFELTPGETRNVTAYYWNGPDGLDPEIESSLELTIRGCPDGVDPETVDDPVAACTEPLDAPDAATIEIGGEQTAIAAATRLDDGTYQFAGLPAFSAPVFWDLFPVAHDHYVVSAPAEIAGPTGYRVYLDRGEHAQVFLFYWNDDGGAGTESATLDMTLRGCPDGVDPSQIDDPASACTIPLDAPDAAMALWGPEGGASLIDSPRLNDGTYEITGIPTPMDVGFTDFEPTVRNSYYFVGIDGKNQQGVPFATLQAGETRAIQVFYYNAS